MRSVPFFMDKVRDIFSSGYVLIVCSAVLMSLISFIIVTINREYAIPPTEIAFLRYVLVSALLIPLLRMRHVSMRLPDMSTHILVMWFGLAMAVIGITWTCSATETGAAVSTVLVNTSPAFAGILGWLILRERMTWGLGASIAACMVGCVMVCGVVSLGVWEKLSTFGVVMGIVSSLFYAVYALLGRAVASRHINPWVSLGYVFIYSTIFLGLFNVIMNLINPNSLMSFSFSHIMELKTGAWLLMMLLAFVPTLLGFALYNMGLGKLPAVVANTIVLLEPALASIWGMLFLGEELTLGQWSGLALIIAGVACIPHKKKKAPQSPPQPDELPAASAAAYDELRSTLQTATTVAPGIAPVPPASFTRQN